jgi:hypothetical protein
MLMLLLLMLMLMLLLLMLMLMLLLLMLLLLMLAKDSNERCSCWLLGADMRDRADIEELMFDVKTEAYDQKRKLALEEVKRQYFDDLTAGEIAEAITEMNDDDCFSSLERACRHKSPLSIGQNIIAAVDAYIDRQAEQEIQRRERKGDL